MRMAKGYDFMSVHFRECVCVRSTFGEFYNHFVMRCVRVMANISYVLPLYVFMCSGNSWQ